jgi:hypothetical protein
MQVNITPEAISRAARTCMLADLSIRVYEGRIKDRDTEAEVATNKQAKSKSAVSVQKYLFADCAEMDAIKKHVAKVRQGVHYPLTSPWSDSGTRVLHMVNHQRYRTAINQARDEFWKLVEQFLDHYDTLVAAAAFKLGDLFDRSQYLTRAQVASKFAFEFELSPMPTSGDFRIDMETAAQRELVAHYEDVMAKRVREAQMTAWQSLHDTLKHISDRLTVGPDGKRNAFHDTLVSNARDLCDRLTGLNVTGDPALERARQELEEVMLGVTPEALRKELDTRAAVKSKVDAVLSQFDWA